MRKSFWILLILLFGAQFASAHIYLEKNYQNYWCEKNNGLAEFKLDDKTRVDCLTSTHAIEFDFAPKWAESIGQSLYYAIKTGKKPLVVLILESKKDNKYLKRLNAVAEKLQIEVVTITPEDLSTRP